MSDRRVSVAIFVLVFVTYGYFYGGGGWHQNTNMDLTRALVEQRSLAIDAYAANTGDVAHGEGGLTYSNKPPGVPLLGVPVYAVLHAVDAARGKNPDDPFVLLLNAWFVSLAVCATAGAALASAVYLYLRREADAPPARAAAIALLLAFGTYLFAYSTVYFMHVPNALFLFLAFAQAPRRPLLAGAFGGAAILCNYLCVPAVAIIALLAGRRGLIRFALGAAPFLVVLMGYQAAAFGSPFRSSIETENETFREEGALFGVLRVPSFRVLWEILVGRYRGLFYLSPVLIAAIVGSVMMVRRRILLRPLAIIGALVAFHLLFNMSFNGWYGGNGVGPRYILPIVPLLALPMLFAFDRLRAVWTALAAVSIAVNFIVAAVNPMVSEEVLDPIGQYMLPLFVTGQLSESLPPRPYNWWRVLGDPVSTNIQPPDSSGPFTTHRRPAPIHRWASFNAGEFLWPATRVSVLPVALWMLAGGAWVIRRAAARPAGG